MEKKKDGFIFFGCVIVLTIVIGLCYWLITDGKPDQIAENYNQLEIYVEFSSGIKKIHIWKDEADNYFFFLPSGAGNCNVTFGNLGEDSRIWLNDEYFGTKDNLGIFLGTVSPEQTIYLTMETGGQKREPISVRFLQSENVAAMFIDLDIDSLENIHMDKEAKETGFMQLVDSDGSVCYRGSMRYIKTRGNSTWAYDKKAYQIRLNKEATLLNMPAAEKWILLANVVDDTLIKNEIVFRYAEKYTSVPSIKGQFVDLYINGEYRGNYYLCEKIEINENRLNIMDLDEATERVNNTRKYNEAMPYVSEDGRIKATQGLNNPEDITGGYLVEYIPDREYEVAENAFQTNSGACYSIVSPSPATVEQAEYICRIFNEMECAMMQKDGMNPVTGKHFSEYLDLNSWAEKYVMEEVFHDPDAALASMYMYKDSDSVSPLIYSGPMWDYDRALGSYGRRIYAMDDARQVGNYGIYVKNLMNFEEVTDLVNKKFEEMIPYVENVARADIYGLNQQLRASADMDMARWGQIFGYYADRDASVDYLADFLETKKNYLKEVWLEKDDNYCTVTFLDYYGGVYRTYHIKKGEYLADVPVISSYVAIFAGWYVQGEDIPYISELPVLSDTTYESRWIGIDIILQNGLNELDMDLSQVDPETLEDMANMVREMQNDPEGGN